MAKAGFTSKGVDVTAHDIRVARLRSTYFRRDLATYEVANAYKYLGSTPDERFDVTSAFSVFQWVMIQRGPESGLGWTVLGLRSLCWLRGLCADAVCAEVRAWALAAFVGRVYGVGTVLCQHGRRGLPQGCWLAWRFQAIKSNADSSDQFEGGTPSLFRGAFSLVTEALCAAPRAYRWT